MAESKLTLPLGDLLEDPIDEARATRLRRRIAVRRRQRRAPLSRRWALAVAAAATLAVAVPAGVYWTGLGRPAAGPPARAEAGPVRVLGRGVLDRLAVADDAAGAEELSLDDGGSRLRLEPGTSLVASRNDGRAVDVALGRGATTFDIRPGGPRLWSIEAGPVRVVVVGTRFRVERGESEVVVSVDRGRVRVSGEPVEGGQVVLGAGEELRLPLGPAPGVASAAARTAEPAAPAAVEEPGDRTVAPPAPGPASGRSRGRDGWRGLAGREEFEEAYALLGSRGLERETRAARSIDELLVLADVARRSGHPAEAVGPLERSIASFPSDRRAAVAAFSLGRLELEVLRRPGRAARAFDRCLDLGPPSALAEHAAARRVEARAALGDRAGAEAAARDYLRRFPTGARADAVRRLGGL